MKAVLFDCDGVLINSEELIELALQDAYAALGVHYTLADIREKFIGHTHEEYLRRREVEFTLATGQPLPPEFAKLLEAAFRARATDELKAFPGITDLLDDLEAAGIPFAVASNSGLNNLISKLHQTGLHDNLHPHIYSREQVAKGKPEPDVYLHAAQMLGVDPKDCIVVEDSPPGVRAGVAAGAYVIGIARQDQTLPADRSRLIGAGADETVDDAVELKIRIFSLLAEPRPGKRPTCRPPSPHPGPSP